jgi:uncharacterized membrane protein YdjX (TVP38/TMEM64 family)
MRENSHNINKANRTFSKILKVLREFEWKHRNIILLMISILIAWFLFQFHGTHVFLQKLGSFGYLGSFLAGIMFTYAFTVAPATSIILVLGETLNPILIALIGATGAVISDYLIFRFVRDKLMDEIKLLSKEIDEFSKPISEMVIKQKVRILIWKKISRSRILKMIIPIVAGLIIASPLPDEIGVALFGATRFERRKFLLISYLLNFLGILVIGYLGKIFY